MFFYITTKDILNEDVFLCMKEEKHEPYIFFSKDKKDRMYFSSKAELDYFFRSEYGKKIKTTAELKVMEIEDLSILGALVEKRGTNNIAFFTYLFLQNGSEQ